MDRGVYGEFGVQRVLGRFARPWVVTLIVTGTWLAVLLATAGGDPLVFVRVGSKFAELDPGGSIGYDGQFYYYMARDLRQGWRHVDIPAYRYQRILYPLLARVLALGNERLLPWALVGISLTSVVASVAIVEALLVECGVSRWYALSVGLFGGHLFCVVASLAEPLALCLGLAAMLLYARDRVGWSACCFALAVLTRETTLLLVAGYVLSMLLRRSIRQGLLFGGTVVLAFVAWQLCLSVWLGSFGVGAGGAGATPFHVTPFGALFSVLHVGWATFLLFAVILVPFIALPTVWAILSTGWDILRGERHPWAFALVLFALVIPFLPASTFLDLSAMPRFASPLVALVVLYAARTKRHRVLRISLLWMTTVTLVPFV